MTDREYWLQHARRVCLRINVAWFLQTLAAPLVILSLAAAAAILVLRNHLEIPRTTLAISIGSGLVVLVVASIFFAARRFEKPEISLVRLEANMELHNALTAASAGIAPWPAAVTPANPGIRWHWPRLVIPPLAALALLAAGIFIPVSTAKNIPTPPEQPQAWKQIDANLEHLAKEEIVDEKYLEETREKLAELRAQTEEQWFSHSSLEATDSLEKEHRSEMERVERELDRAGNALESLQKNPAASQAEKDRQIGEFQQALEGLQNGAMKPNPELLEKMKQLNPGALGKLDKEQMRQLRENLKKNSDAMKNTPGQNGDDWSDELLAGENPEGENGNGGEKPGDGPGQGGVARGPGHDPNLLGQEKDGLETGELTAIDSKDLSRALPGDLLQLQDGEHDLDKSASKSTQGGDTQATGAGGDRIWKESLDPDEQRTLKKFFE